MRMRNHMVNTNRLFVALKGADRARLAPHMRRFELVKDAVLYEVGDSIDTLYFPLSGQVALVIVSEDGSELSRAQAAGSLVRPPSGLQAAVRTYPTEPAAPESRRPDDPSCARGRAWSRARQTARAMVR